MTKSPVAAIALHQLRIRSRRMTSVVTLLAIVLMTWLAVPDPSSGMTMMAINDARVIYDSQCLAIAGSTLMSLLLSLAGFYLVRGSMRTDLVVGVSAALGATCVSNQQLLIGRWLGAVVYLMVMAGLSMASLLVLHALRGEGPILVSVYLQHFGVILLPEVLFVASMSILFDAWAPLMGKAGDMLFFVVWVLVLALAGAEGAQLTGRWPLALWSDFSGLANVMYGLHLLVHTTRISIGVASFDTALQPIVIADDFWTTPMVLVRLLCAATALLPLLPALLLFHRFSPDRLNPKLTRRRRSQLNLCNGLSASLARLVEPLYRAAMRLPGDAAGAIAEVALLLSSNPIAMPIALLAFFAGGLAPSQILPAIVLVTVAFWGIVISDSSVRDGLAGIESITAALPGGAIKRYLRRHLSCWALGVLITLPVALRWVMAQPLRSVALLAGLFALSALAHLLGRLTNTARTFIALFLFCIYLSTQVDHVPALDPVGMHGVATLGSVLATALVGTVALSIGLALAAARRLR